MMIMICMKFSVNTFIKRRVTSDTEVFRNRFNRSEMLELLDLKLQCAAEMSLA